MSLLGNIFRDEPDQDDPWLGQAHGQQRDRVIQLLISVVFGFSAFLSFCVLRPRWSELYNARRTQSQAASRLPELPKSLFGWIPMVWRISRAEVLASAGLDAYVFLCFFRYAIKYLSISLFFALTILLPVNNHFNDECYGYTVFCGPNNSTNSSHAIPQRYLFADGKDNDNKTGDASLRYLWMYTVFAYVFTAIALYLLIDETADIIRIRQAYLGTQSTITDRTIRLSGIPEGMRSEEQITAFVENLSIGKVENVMLCRNWETLDDAMGERMRCLRNLEKVWAKYLGSHQVRQARKPRREVEQQSNEDDETQSLIPHDEVDHDNTYLRHRKRPQHTMRFGFFGSSSKKVDAIDYYEEKLRRLDDKVDTLRKQEFEATALAFVTMESTAACQMAVQAILDPNPGQFIASAAPPPADVVWSNTYLSRNNRMVRAWSIMTVIGFLSIFWVGLFAPLAALLTIEAIDKVLPGLADALDQHPVLASLIKTGLPTLSLSLLAVAVPYLYDWLANMQGMTSQGEVELSVISKNFFFTFFNLFIVFTLQAAGATFIQFWDKLRDILKDATGVALTIALSLQKLSNFYCNLIILQGLGLFPFRLLEIGTVSLYPFYLIGATTPRDHADLVKAPVFSYGFYLPQSMLVFVICIVYSVFPSSWLITLFGLIYFVIGNFVYKYQLLYAMDHREHSTGKAWPMICNRIILGLIIFHIALLGTLSLQRAFYQAVFIGPLLVGTVWFTVWFQRTYFPLMRFIALKSIDDRETSPIMPNPSLSASDRDTDHGRTVEIDPATNRPVRYINPSLVSPLEKLWVRRPGPRQPRQNV